MLANTIACQGSRFIVAAPGLCPFPSRFIKQLSEGNGREDGDHGPGWCVKEKDLQHTRGMEAVSGSLHACCTLLVERVRQC